MSLHPKITAFFPQRTRAKGDQYFACNRVELANPQPDGVQAAVSGTMNYIVFIPAISPLEGASCGCPAFYEWGPCKHIWATFRAIEHEGIATVTPASLLPGPEVEGILHSDTPGEEMEDDEWNEAGAEYFLEHLEGAIKTIEALASPDPQVHQQKPNSYHWQQHFARARNASDEAATPARTQDRYLFLLEEEPLEIHGKLVLQLYARKVKKDGTWSKPKRLSLSNKNPDEFTDPVDRQAVAALCGPSEYSPYSCYGSYGYGYGTTALSKGHCELLLPLLARQGKLGLNREDQQEPFMLSWEDEPWSFVLSVGLTPDKDLLLKAILRRGGQDHSPLEPGLFIAENHIISDTAIAPLTTPQALAITQGLRGNDSILVPAEDKAKFLKSLMVQAGDLPVEFDPALKIDCTSMVPTPVLRVLDDESQRGSRNLSAQLLYDIDGRTCSHGAGQKGHFDQDRNQLVRYDFSGLDHDPVEQLRELGVTFRNEYRYSSSRMVQGFFQMKRSALPAVVRALLEKGWQVEGHKGAFREFTPEIK
ncbi:MAG: hypothetical protein GF344_10590 [Chitinivibrionales bacterium]|nr:hypothetical protein [Chitinivibrionales bacterium]